MKVADAGPNVAPFTAALLLVPTLTRIVCGVNPGSALKEAGAPAVTVIVPSTPLLIRENRNPEMACRCRPRHCGDRWRIGHVRAIRTRWEDVGATGRRGWSRVGVEVESQVALDIDGDRCRDGYADLRRRRSARTGARRRAGGKRHGRYERKARADRQSPNLHCFCSNPVIRSVGLYGEPRTQSTLLTPQNARGPWLSESGESPTLALRARPAR